MLPKDKQLHALAGLAIALPVSAVGHPGLALGMAVAAGVGKEIYDYYHPLDHTADLMDALATIGGGVLGVALGLLING
jgi:hypothetical protein